MYLFEIYSMHYYKMYWYNTRENLEQNTSTDMHDILDSTHYGRVF